MPPKSSSSLSSHNEPVKILMIHGYTQNGPLFNVKTKVLQKTLTKVLPQVKFSYPTAPWRLRPSQIPSFDPALLQSTAAADDESESEFYGWWRRSDTSDPPEYMGLEEGLQTVADTLKHEGPFDGIMGFSQGAAMATMVASLLDSGRKAAFERAKEKSSLAISYPAAFDEENLQHPPLKFCIVYGGFVAPGVRYRGFYEDPVVQTRMLHVIGSLDGVVEEAKTQGLIDAAGGQSNTTVLIHPGGHFVPNGKQYVEAVAAFVRDSLKSGSGSSRDGEEEKAEDIDLPF